MVNTIIGASIFGLPSLLAAHLGRFSPAGYLVMAAGIGAIATCLAEVASQFRQAGGPYLYARVSFGQFAAVQVGWLTWLTPDRRFRSGCRSFRVISGPVFPGRRGLGCAVDGCWGCLSGFSLSLTTSE